jgi:Putative transposase DNA-binding domain
MRGRTIVAQAVRTDHSGWRFFQLRTCVAYKAHITGIRVEIVQPHSTGQSCSRCGPLGTRRGKHFACEACGQEADADRNAADNLRLLGTFVTPPGGPCCSLPQGTTTGCSAPGFSQALAVGTVTTSAIASKTGAMEPAPACPGSLSPGAANVGKRDPSNLPSLLSRRQGSNAVLQGLVCSARLGARCILPD